MPDFEEPIYYKPYVPGKVVVSRTTYFVMCALSALGCLTLFFIVFA